jgi:hypothetical protein
MTVFGSWVLLGWKEESVADWLTIRLGSLANETPEIQYRDVIRVTFPLPAAKRR